MKIIDTHAHYDDEKFNEDRDSLITSLISNNIESVVNIGANMSSSRASIALAEKYNHVFAAVGVHPSETACMQEKDIEDLKKMCVHPKVVAIGEIGLDYYWEEPDKSIQKKWFIKQLELAKEVNLPIVIHSRDAAKDTLDIITSEKAYERVGVVHCYSYSLETAKKYLDFGYYFGIGGVLTFNNAKKLKEVVEFLPIESVVLETDCPYLAPVPYRGKRNSSIYIPYIVSAIAQIKHISEQEIIDITNQNAKKLYPKMNNYKL